MTGKRFEKKEKIIGMCLLILSLVFSDLIIMRLWGHLIKPDSTNNSFVYFDEEIGKLHRPNVTVRRIWPESSQGSIIFKTNNLGFREDHHTSIKKDIQYRIIVFGGSHVDGVVNNIDSFPNQAELILTDEGYDVDIINAGVGTYSLYQQFLLFKRTLYLSPNLVVFTLYVGNDYLDMVQGRDRPYLSLQDGVVIVKKPVSPPSPSTFEPLKENSIILFSLYTIYSEAVKMFSPLPKVTGYREKINQALEVSEPAWW